MAIGGDILIKLAADVAELRQGFDQARREAKKTSDSLSTITNGLKAIAGAAVLDRVVSTLTAMARSVGDIGEQAEALQLTNTQFQGIKDAAIQGGLGVEGFATSFNKLNKEIGNAVEGNKESIARFEELGVRLIDAEGNLRDTAAVAAELAGKIQNLDQPNQRAAKSMEFFGRSGAAVLPVMAQLEQGADALAAALARRGGIASDETIQKLDKFFDSIESTKGVLTVQGGTFFANILPEGNALTTMLERLGNQLVKLSEQQWFQSLASAITVGLLGPLKLAADQFMLLSQFAIDFGDHWSRVVAGAELALRTWVVMMIESANTAAQSSAKAAEAWVNHWIRVLNLFVTSAAQQLPDWARSMLGITGNITVIEPITLDFKVVGQESIDAANKALEASRTQLERVKTNIAQAGMQADETAARIGKLPGVGAPGRTQPPPKATGGKTPRDRVQEMLDELVGRQRAEEKALKALQDASTATPLKELEKAVELQKKIDETIAKVASKEKGGASPELIEKITAQVTATENATVATKDYQEAIRAAASIDAQFGDGTAQLAERMLELNEALATGRLSWEAYSAAVADAGERQREQYFQAERAKGGVDGFIAGWQSASDQFAKANDEFAAGGQVFQGVTDLMTQGIRQFAAEGKVEFAGLLSAFLAMLAEMAAKAAVSFAFKALQSYFGGGTGLAGSGETFANGSTNDLIPGVAYTVGEFGRETFIPRVAGQIMTAEDMAEGWDRGPQVSQTINISTGVQQTVRAEIQSMMPMIARAGAEQARAQRQRGGSYKSSFR